MSDDVQQVEPAITVADITKSFKIPLEASSGIKQKLVNTIQGRKGYREFTPLNDISFTVNKGDFFGIVGRNGSGKSTLLKTIAGIYEPNKGSVQVNGTLVPFIELGVGFNPELTGRENVFLNGALLGFSKSEIVAMYDEIVDFAELHDFMEERLKNYSSGMQVRLAFSIAIKAEGDILLLDEVLAVGDAAFQQKCFTYFEQLKKENRTIVLVTHDMSSVTRFCTRAMYIENGKIIADGTPEDISDIYTLRNIESGEVEKVSGLDKNYTIRSKLEAQTSDGVSIRFSINTKTKDELYLGVSIFKDGICVSQMNSKSSTLLSKSGDVDLYIQTDIFNPGVYEMTSALFTVAQKELVAIPKDRIKFLIKGNDDTRGGAIKLEDTWKKV
jgi:ABC-2 type transport system ATP-binding protein